MPRSHRRTKARRPLESNARADQLADAVSRTVDSSERPQHRHRDSHRGSPPPHSPPEVGDRRRRRRGPDDERGGKRCRADDERGVTSTSVWESGNDNAAPRVENDHTESTRQDGTTSPVEAVPSGVGTSTSATNTASAASPLAIALEVKLRELVKALTPTIQERDCKVAVLRDVRRAMRAIGLRVDIYGSLATGLCIPSSDIDCVLVPLSREEDLAGSGDGQRSRMPPALERTIHGIANAHVMSVKERKTMFSAGVRVVANAMRSSRCFRNVLPIAHAKVPIVKCEHRNEDLKVDLSFEKDGLISSRFLCTEFQRPGNELARPLIVLVKSMVASWGLADPSVGGLGSFPTSLMVLWFLQTEVAERYPPELRDSLAVLLVGFLQYYSHNFDYTRKGIDYVKRSAFTRPPSSEIFIVNPIKPGTSCARAATLYASRLVPCFSQAAKALSDVLDSATSEAKVEATLDRFFASALPECREWRLVHRRASLYRLGGPNQWDPETHFYIGGAM